MQVSPHVDDLKGGTRRDVLSSGSATTVHFPSFHIQSSGPSGVSGYYDASHDASAPLAADSRDLTAIVGAEPKGLPFDSLS